MSDVHDDARVSVGRVTRYLRDHVPATVEDPDLAQAAVALVVAPDPSAILFIRRATRDGDPWSGQMALPGGKSDLADADLRATAIRETSEEVAISLESAADLVAGAANSRPQHLEAALAMHRQHADTRTAGPARRGFDRVRNVVQLYIEKDAAARLGNRAHRLRTDAGEELEADLEQPDLPFEAPHPRERVVDGGNVEGEDDGVRISLRHGSHR